MISSHPILLLSSLVGLTYSLPLHTKDQCNSSHMTSFASVNSSVPVTTSPMAPLEGANISSMNGTVFEEWYWDLFAPVSDANNGSSVAGLTITFKRDPMLADYGYGNLFMEVSAVFPNGTQYLSIDFASESTVSVCNSGFTTGTWHSISGDGGSANFAVSNDMEEAVLTFNTSSVKGTYTLSSFTVPHTPDGLTSPNSTASTELSPMIYWQEPVSAGVATADLMLDGTPFVMTGYGGNDHAWASAGWEALTSGTLFFRAVAGPYTVVYWTIDSTVAGKAGTYTSAYVIERYTETPMFSVGPLEDTEITAKREIDVNVTLTYGGSMSGSFADKSTGYVATFTDAGKAWSFTVEHGYIVMEQGWDTESIDGVSIFVDTVTGGEVGGEVYTGVALTEQNTY